MVTMRFVVSQEQQINVGMREKLTPPVTSQRNQATIILIGKALLPQCQT